MSEATHHTPSPGPGHADNDVQLGPVVLFGVTLIIITGLVLWLMGWLFNVFSSRHAARDLPPSALAQSRPALPSEPRLQVAPAQELQQMRADEEAALHSYGWIDQTAGVVRIPIDRAMDLLLERGLPVRPEAPATSPRGAPQ